MWMGPGTWLVLCHQVVCYSNTQEGWARLLCMAVDAGLRTTVMVGQTCFMFSCPKSPCMKISDKRQSLFLSQVIQ